MRSVLVKILAILVLPIMLVSCFKAPSGGDVIDPGAVDNRFTSDDYKIAVFANGEPHGFFARNDRGNGFPFDCSFMRSNAVIENGTLSLILSGDAGGYTGAEYRMWSKTGYGFYSVKMKAAACPGVISSFFTYNGFPWDEIDVEFLGDDTTKVQFNYYTHGVGGHEYVYHLGFDASKEFHEYAFDWQEGSITWYVDGVAVYRATENIPTTPGNIMMNVWNVNVAHANWAGRFDPSYLPVRAEYQWIGYQSAENGADI